MLLFDQWFSVLDTVSKTKCIRYLVKSYILPFVTSLGQGSARSGDIMTLAGEAIAQDLRGVMVWYCSVVGGLKYEESWDCSGSQESMEAYILAMQHLNDASR